MASSDDEGETFPDAISEYRFFDEADEAISFSELPVQWNENESSSTSVGPIFLDGRVDIGKFYKQVKAWKYDIVNVTPEISVLSKDNHWIKLKKPRKCYEDLIRSILVCVHCLCFFKNKPEASGKSLWDHLLNLKVFRLHDIRPSENDLIDHINFLREAVKRDETLAKSKFLAAFLENPRKKNSSNGDAGTATKPSFIVDDVNGELQDDDTTNQAEDSESDDEDDHFDSVCAICDNGGIITCCEGKCFRSFHATPDSEEAQESNCESLCFSKELEDHEQYKCENCKYNLHQCFVCGELGSSDKSSNTEVFRCSSATCGHFYHPKCVAKLLQKNVTEQQTLKEKIAAGEPFTCPAHKCAVCKQTENEKVVELQFAICRRCPKSYHRKCLPRNIMFEHQDEDDDDDDDDDDDQEVRAWDGLLSKSRALIYCIEHEIDQELGTPARTIIYRNILNRKADQQQKKKLPVKVAGVSSVDPSKKKSVLKSQENVETYSVIKRDGSSKKRAAVSSGLESSKKKKVADASKNSLRSVPKKVKRPSPNDGQPTLGSRLFDFHTRTESTIKKDETFIDDNNQSVAAKSQEMEILPPLDEESKQRIMALMREAASSVTLDKVKKDYKEKLPSTHAHSSRVDKSIILSRVEGSVEALNLALKKLEEGCSVEDAMAVCEPGVIDQLLKWKDKLKVYLAPFLHGMRYTSFGRHFTQVAKLEKIVDKLHWYVEDGDTILDFCCGANDFSCLMKKKLDEMGKKKCSYKNYDFTRATNDFNFEKRDWMKVSPKELPCSGSQLIMGLNPPFGVNASLANKFIDHALKFEPKLIILIVPPQTERLDSAYKPVPYDLLWEDAELLAHKSFYLPGSVDVSDKQMGQWNNIAPPLYLWSRPEFTSKHKSIAQEHGHTPHQLQQPPRSDAKLTISGVAIDKYEIDGDLPVINADSKTTSKAKEPKDKKRKKESPGGTETKSKQIAGDGKGNKNLSKKTRHNQESNIEDHDDQGSNRQDLAQKLEEAQDPIKAKQCEKVRVPVEAQKRGLTQASVDAKKRESAQAPVEVQKHDKKLDPVESQKHENTQDAVKAQKHELTRPPSREIKVQKPQTTLVPCCELESRKHEKSQAPSRETEDQKHEKSRAISPETAAQRHENAGASPRETEPQKHEKAQDSPREAVAPKHEKARASPRKNEPQKHEKARVPPRETEALKHEKAKASPREIEVQKHEKACAPGTETQKHEKARAAPCEIEAQKHEKAWASPPGSETQKHERARASTREIEAQKHEKARVSPCEIEAQKHERARASSREIEAQKHEKAWASPREIEAQKHEKARVSPREFETQKRERTWPPSRESEAQRFESKRRSPQTREEKLHETLNTDFSFVDVDQPFDQQFNKSAIDESTFSLQNDDYVVRKYNPVNEESYMGSKSHRRLDGAIHAAPGYSMRSDHLQYHAYDRVVSRGPMADDSSARAGGAYTMARHEPVSTRYNNPDATPYNRTSTSATQRYAPRLDELNHVKRTEPEMNHVRMGGMGRSEPQAMGGRGVGYYRPPVNVPTLRTDSLGFAPGSYHHYPHNSSGGWLDE